jgi:hypothetical protein
MVLLGGRESEYFSATLEQDPAPSFQPECFALPGSVWRTSHITTEILNTDFIAYKQLIILQHYMIF